MSVADDVAGLVGSINDAWLNGRFDELEQYFAPEMVLAMPGLHQRVEGRDPVIATYRDFCTQAIVRRFKTAETTVDVMDRTAVAVTKFEIEYAFGGEDYVERGTDMLVFQLGDGFWRVVWRTVFMSA